MNWLGWYQNPILDRPTTLTWLEAAHFSFTFCYVVIKRFVTLVCERCCTNKAYLLTYYFWFWVWSFFADKIMVSVLVWMTYHWCQWPKLIGIRDERIKDFIADLGKNTRYKSIMVNFPLSGNSLHISCHSKVKNVSTWLKAQLVCCISQITSWIRCVELL